MLGRAGLWLCALAVGTLPARGYVEVTGTARRSTLVDYLRSSSAGLDEAQCLARVADLQSSPYAFLKGTPELFFADLEAQDELTYNEFASEAASTWLVGDATFEKLGVFENDRGQRIFDFIDADDAWVASYLLDVYRLAASLSVLAKDEGASPYEAVVTFVDYYIEKLREFVDLPGLRNINAAQVTAGGYPKATLEGALADRAELLRTWEEGTVAASTGEHTAVDAAVQSYATRSSLGDAAYFAVKSVVKMSGASYTAPSFRVRVEGASAQNATDDQVLWVKAQLPYPPLVDYVSASQQRRFDGTALADPAARVAAAHDAMLINTVDGLGATMLNGQPATVQLLSPCFTMATYASIRSHITNTPAHGGYGVFFLAGNMGTLLAGVHARSSMKGNLTDPRDRSFEGEVLRMVSTDTLTIRFKTEVAQFAAEYAKQATADSNTTSLAQEACTRPVWELQRGAARSQAVAAAVTLSQQQRSTPPPWALCVERAAALASSVADFLPAAGRLFYADTLATIQRSGLYGGGLSTWVHGNAHLGSVRVAAVLRSGQVGLGLTDFDHAWYENYLVDVYHMAVSVALAAADANTPTSDLVRQFVESYLAAAQTSAEEAATREVTAATASSWVATRLRQAEQYNTRAGMLSSLTDLNGAFVASPTDGMMAVATAEEAAAVVEAVRDYTSDSNSSVVTAVARGTGAMAATTYYALMSDDRLLQLRLVTEPAIYAQLSAAGKARVEELVPAGQPAMAFVLSEAARRMRQEEAPRVSYTRPLCAGRRQWAVREVAPVEFSQLLPLQGGEEATALVTDAATVLAVAHLRGEPAFRDALAAFLAAASTSSAVLVDEVVTFATAYALQVQEDHETFRSLFARGAEEVCGSDPGGSVSSLAACGDAVAAGSPTPAGTPEQQEEEKEKVVESEESGAATAALRRCSWVGVVMATAVVGLAWA